MEEAVMQSTRTLPALLCAAAVVFLTASTAQAQDAVSIHAEVSWSPYGLGESSWPNYWGDFEASGAVADSGGVQYGPWYPNSALELYGSAGKIRILLDNNGAWFIEAGTGAYEYLQGGGTYTDVSYVVDDPWLGKTYVIEFELTGTASIIENVLPQADLIVASVGDLTAVLDASGSVDADGSILRYEWDLDGDGLYDHTSTYSAIQYTYAEDGTYLASVRVTDDRGGSDIASVSVTVQAPPPPKDERPGKGKSGKGKKK
jgi:hypothetical protein